MLVKQVAEDPGFADAIAKSGDKVDYADAETTSQAWGNEHENLQKLFSRMYKNKRS